MKKMGESSGGRKALFLDRDGVINHDPGDYTKSLSEFVVLPGVVETLKAWHEMGFLLIVVTNQGGLAKGLYDESDVHAMHQYFQGLCVQAGFSVAEFYFCPHHPDFNGRCLCRKPGSLMVEKGLHQFGLDPELCWIIGDKQRDLDAAAAAGVGGTRIETNARIPLPEEVLHAFN
jgi:D-glycero-D-manno-heptose 1,7-bisphosphate phosphatase